MGQDLVELEALKRNLTSRDWDNPLIPFLKSRENKFWNNISTTHTAAFITSVRSSFCHKFI